MNIEELIKVDGVFFPKGFLQLSDKDKAGICNGAGAAGSLLSYAIPNTLYGLNCITAFNVHDYQYFIGGNSKAKKFADDLMLINLYQIINKRGGVLKPFRRARAYLYFVAVDKFGGSAWRS